jgi:AAA family ATP:ADP antiporter
MLLNIANTSGEFLVGKLVSQEAERAVGAGAEFAKQRRAFIGEFYGDYYSWVNLVGFLFQTFLVSRLFRYVNVTGALFVLPLISLGGYALLAAAPVLSLVRMVKIFENATDYSVNNTTRNALFLATSREAKFKAKAAIDTFFMRGGDVLAAGVVYLASSWALGLNQFAMVVVGVVVVWLFICWKLVALYRQRAGGATPAPTGR